MKNGWWDRWLNPFLRKIPLSLPDTVYVIFREDGEVSGVVSNAEQLFFHSCDDLIFEYRVVRRVKLKRDLQIVPFVPEEAPIVPGTGGER